MIFSSVVAILAVSVFKLLDSKQTISLDDKDYDIIKIQNEEHNELNNYDCSIN